MLKWWSFMLIGCIMFTGSAVMLKTQAVAPNLLPLAVNAVSYLINSMHSTSNEVNVRCNLIVLCVGRPNTEKIETLRQIVFLNRDWSVFPYSCSYQSLWTCSTICVWEVWYKSFSIKQLVVFSHSCHSKLRIAEQGARRCVSLLLFFFADPLEKHWISVWGFNRYAKNINRNRPGNLVELNWQKWKLDAGCVRKCVIICIADGDVVSDVVCAAMGCIDTKKWVFVSPFVFQFFGSGAQVGHGTKRFLKWGLWTAGIFNECLNKMQLFKYVTFTAG